MTKPIKYKVGDKIKIIRATDGCYGAEGKIGIVTNKPSTDGLCDNKDGFNVDCGCGHVWRICFESECKLLDELTAEAAIRLNAKMCENTLCPECKFWKHNNSEDISCNEFSQKYPEQVVEALKQWKRDHEKKEVETEFVDFIQIMKKEGNSVTCIYTYKIDMDKENVDEKMDELIKQYYEENGGKIYAKCERICRVKPSNFV